MADYIVKDTELTSVANAIRTAGGTNSLLNFPNGFVSAVNNISGGSSSDFSTAEVTVVNNSETEYLQAYIPEVIANTNLSRGAAIDGDPSSTETHTVILAKDGCEMSIVGLSLNIEASGNASVNRGMMGYVVTITGDCTITASDPT